VEEFQNSIAERSEAEFKLRFSFFCSAIVCTPEKIGIFQTGISLRPKGADPRNLAGA
jgi:hypothetical protein